MNAYYYFEGGVIAIRGGPEAIGALKNFADDIATRLNGIKDIGDRADLLLKEFNSAVDFASGSEDLGKSLAVTGGVAFGIGLGLAIGGTGALAVGAGLALGWLGDKLYEKAIQGRMESASGQERRRMTYGDPGLTTSQMKNSIAPAPGASPSIP